MAKTREQKEADVKILAEAFSGSKIAVMTDYRGLDVPAINDLRNQLDQWQSPLDKTKPKPAKLLQTSQKPTRISKYSAQLMRRAIRSAAKK